MHCRNHQQQKVCIVDKNEPPEASPEASHRTRRRWLIAAGTFTGILFLMFVYAVCMIPATPSVDDLQHARNEQPSLLLSSDGRTLATFRQVQQEWVDLDHVSPYVIKALIATEDRRFYEHNGIDVNRTLAAAFHTASGDTQGGSTITQQLARNIFPDEIGRSRTVTRKLKELITALKIEHAYSKKQILETYLNTVPFLYNVTGIEMAARTYFNKPAIDLDILESATLVGMLKGTSFYNPVAYPERAQKRRNLVLAQMVKQRDLPDAEYRRLTGQPLVVHFSRQMDEYDDSAPHFTAYVRRWLNEWAQQNDIDLSADGLVVYTTIDLTLQQAATHAVARQADALQQIADVEWGQSGNRTISNAPSTYAKLHKQVEPFRHFWNSNRELVDNFIRETPEFRKAVSGGKSAAAALAKLHADTHFMARLRDDKTRLEAGFIAMDPASGEIKAWVGSRDFNRDQFDHVAQAARQPGSTFKPIVYGAALEQGFSPDRAYVDRVIPIRAPDGSIWKPADMEAPTWQNMTLRDGLVYSKNTITAQVMQDVGLPNIVNLAQSLGINRSRLDPVPSLALGTSPVTLLEMVSAYSTIATAGEYRKPLFVKRITDRSGKVLAEFENDDASKPRRVMTEDSALELIDMMRGVINRGTGTVIKTRFGILADIAGKTGTTQNNTDGWFILMHPNLVAGAWVGFNDARVTMRSNYWGQGGHNAALLIGDFFRDTLKAKLIDPKARFPLPKRFEMLVRNEFPQSEGDSGDPPSGMGVITRSDGSRIVIGSPAADASARAAPAASPAVPASRTGWENNTLFEPNHN
jgi:penicillin-binding protein 1A